MTRKVLWAREGHCLKNDLGIFEPGFFGEDEESDRTRLSGSRQSESLHEYRRLRKADVHPYPL